jgi:hypothetical protein
MTNMPPSEEVTDIVETREENKAQDTTRHCRDS